MLPTILVVNVIKQKRATRFLQCCSFCVLLYKNLQISYYRYISNIKGSKMSKNNKNNKISYIRPGFLIPMVYCTISGIIMLLAYLVTNNPQMFSESVSQLIMTASTVSIVLSPSALIVCGALSLKHRNKFPLESIFYSDLPVALSFLVLGLQVMYLVMATM